MTLDRIKVAIIDDETFYLDNFREFVPAEVSSGNVECFTSPFSFFSALENGNKYDVIIVDRQMGNYDAVDNDFPTTVRNLGSKGKIILHTSALGSRAEIAGFSSAVPKMTILKEDFC